MKGIRSKILYGLLAGSIITTSYFSSIILLSNKSNESKDDKRILTSNFNLNKNETISNEDIENDFRNYESNSKFNLHEFDKNNSSIYKPFKILGLNNPKTNEQERKLEIGILQNNLAKLELNAWGNTQILYWKLGLTNKINFNNVLKNNFKKTFNLINKTNLINEIVSSVWPSKNLAPKMDLLLWQWNVYTLFEETLKSSKINNNTFSSFSSIVGNKTSNLGHGKIDYEKKWTNDNFNIAKQKINNQLSLDQQTININKNINLDFIRLNIDKNDRFWKSSSNNPEKNTSITIFDNSYSNWTFPKLNINNNVYDLDFFKNIRKQYVFPYQWDSDEHTFYPAFDFSSSNTSYNNFRINLSKLITINNQETSDYYDANNNFHKQAPKIKLGWNLDLFTALKEASLIKDRTLNVFNNLSNIISFDGNIISQFKSLFNDIVKYKADLDIINNYLNQLKESKGLNIAYINKNNQKVNYAKVLEKYDWSMLDYKTDDPLKELGFDNVINQVLKWDIPYKFGLPQVFKNNIYADVKTTGSNEIKRNVKLYDAYSKKWLDYQVPNYGQQQINYDNNVDVELKNIRMMTPNTMEEIASHSNKENDTLNANDIVSLTKQLNSERTNIDLVDNSIKFSFGYNPSIDNTILDTNNKTRSIATFDNYASDIYNFEKIDYVDITLKGLKIPEDIIQKEKDLIWLNESFVSPNLTEDEESIYPEIKKYIDLSKKYRAAANDYANNRISEQEYFNVKKALDELGYFYTNLKIKVPTNYYLAPNEYQRLIDDHSIIPKGYDEISKTYEYWIKYDAKKIPLEINNLDKYIEIKSRKSDIVENKDINELNLEHNRIRTELNLLKNDLNATQNNTKQILKKIEEFINYVNNSYKTIINQNYDLKQKYEIQIKQFNDSLSNIKNEINKRYNEFKQDNSYINNGLKQELNKTFKYNFSLEKMLNLVQENINNLNQLFDAIPEAKNIKETLMIKAKEIKNEYDLEKNKIEYYELELNRHLIQNQKLLNELNQIRKLNYYDELTISFNIEKMIKDSGNEQAKSYWWSLVENEWNSFWFVSKEIFANRLNEIIKLKCNLDFNIIKESLMHDQHEPNKIIKINNNEYQYYFELDSLQNVWLTKLELRLKRNDVININLRNSEIYSKETIRKIENLRTNFEVNNNTINKTLSKISNFKNKFLSNKLVDNLESLIIPNTIENLKLYKSMNDAIKNYKHISIFDERWNSLYMGIIIFSSIALIICVIGLGIYVNSKKRRKTQKVDDEDMKAFLKFKSDDDSENKEIKNKIKEGEL